jgi:hypothetical protein
VPYRRRQSRGGMPRMTASRAMKTSRRRGAETQNAARNSTEWSEQVAIKAHRAGAVATAW